MKQNTKESNANSILQCLWYLLEKLGLHSGQLSIATLNNALVVNTICINSFRYTLVITSTKFRLKQTWRLTKAIAEMKCDTE